MWRTTRHSAPPGAGSPRAQSLSKAQTYAQIFCLLAETSGTLSLIERSFVVFKLCEWHMGTMKTLLSCAPTLLTCAPSSADPMHATTPHPRADLPAPRSQCLSHDPQLHESPVVPPAFLTNVDMHSLHMNVFKNDRPRIKMAI